MLNSRMFRLSARLAPYCPQKQLLTLCKCANDCLTWVMAGAGTLPISSYLHDHGPQHLPAWHTRDMWHAVHMTNAHQQNACQVLSPGQGQLMS